MFFVSYIILVICYMLLIHIIETTVDQISYYYCIFILPGLHSQSESQKESSSEEEEEWEGGKLNSVACGLDGVGLWA